MTAAPGPVGEEAARLAEALADWARGAIGGELPLATGSAECALCPVCQLLAVARRARPETFTHLADATTSLVAALRTVVETHAHASSSSAVQRIDLDADLDADLHDDLDDGGVHRDAPHSGRRG
jgi:hypothetical protein